MRLRIYSDIHLEFGPFEPPTLPDDSQAVLILAGDIDTKSRTLDSIRDWAPRFRAVIVVLGNHDYWNGSIIRTPAKLRHQLSESRQQGELTNLFLLESETVVLDDVAIIGATLWTDFRNRDGAVEMADIAKVESQMNDFRKIRTGPAGSPYQYKVTAAHLASEHQRARAYIEQAVREHRSKGRKTVVVSHHVPSFTLLLGAREGDPLNLAYASRALDDMSGAVVPDLWAFGHQHESVLAMHHGVVCASNPRGYAGIAVNPYFDDKGVNIDTDNLSEWAERLPLARTGRLLSAEREDALLADEYR